VVEDIDRDRSWVDRSRREVSAVGTVLVDSEDRRPVKRCSTAVTEVSGAEEAGDILVTENRFD
jgi:hypothetical protein